MGSKHFLGEGYSVKNARHSAALKALEALTNENHPPFDDNIRNDEVVVNSTGNDLVSDSFVLNRICLLPNISNQR